MNNCIYAFKQRPKVIRYSKVRATNFDISQPLWSACGWANYGADIVPALQQALYDLLTQKSPCARNKDLHKVYSASENRATKRATSSMSSKVTAIGSLFSRQR